MVCGPDKSNRSEYTNRDSPPFGANESECHGTIEQGNDGRAYRSERRGASKSYRWYPVVGKGSGSGSASSSKKKYDQF